MTKKIALIASLILLTLGVHGASYTIAGTIIDATSRESLIAVSVYDSLSRRGVASNNFGHFSLTLNEGPVTLLISYVGYAPRRYELSLKSDTFLPIELTPGVGLQEVVVEAGRQASGAGTSQMSAISIPISQIKSVPALMGEVDVLKVLQLLPGVQSGTEGASGMYVRGGGPDQNLILLDGVPIYNVNHLFGFFSVFNADALKNVTFYKGAFPARFSGRLSSVVDIRMKEGDMKAFHGVASIGLLSAKVNLEGPLIKDRTSFNFSARRTYIDVLAQPLIRLAMTTNSDGTLQDPSAGYYFYDLNAKLNHIINPTNRLYLSFYMGDDAVSSGFEKQEQQYENTTTGSTASDLNSKMSMGMTWGNLVTSVRWNSLLSPKVFMNTTVSYNRYRSNIGLGVDVNSRTTVTTFFPSSSVGEVIAHTAYRMDYASGIEDWGVQSEFDYHPLPEHALKAGFNYINHTFKPEVMSVQSTIDASGMPHEEEEFSTNNGRIQANELSLNAEDDWSIGTRWKLNVGLNFSLFNVKRKTYTSLEPRLSARFLAAENLSLKASYTNMSQYVHLLSNNTISMPTDLWVPTTDNIRPMRSNQLALGLFWDFAKGWEFSIEGYYKQMDNLLEYKEGASFMGASSGWEQKVEQGEGRSYGVEFLLQKKVGAISGWMGYTLAWADRVFPNGTINFGRPFPAKYDRRHDFSTTLVYTISKRVDVSASWIFASGNVATLPLELYPDHEGGNIASPGFSFLTYGTYTEHRNNYRLPSYHRLDVGANFHRFFRWGSRTINVSLFNAYNRMNPYYLYAETNSQGASRLRQVTLFPIIPSISYAVKF